MKMPIPPSASRSQSQHLSVMLYVQDGIFVMAPKPSTQQIFTPPPVWYKRKNTIVSLLFLLMMVLALFVQQGLAAGTLQKLSNGFSFFSFSQTTTDIHMDAHLTTVVNASQQLQRISQLDPAQYSSSSEFNIWAYSACSTAAMTEVFNAYGRHLRITDVLKVEAQIGAITPELGLLDPSGIQQTAAQFGFKTRSSNSWSLDQLINTANAGTPVIVDFPPYKYAGGHILDVIGGDSTYVYLADTSLWNHRAVTHDQFMQWWDGFGAVVTPA